MKILSQGIFAILLGLAIWFFLKNVRRIWGNIQLGKPFDRSDNKNERLRQMLLVAFGQKKMFKRPIPALLHLFVYVGFLLVNIELLEIVLDGILGTHRLFKPLLGDFYTFLINFFEFFAVAVIISCALFLIRRNILKIERFHKPEMSKWPTLDANLILVLEIVLMFFLLSMNATDKLIVEKSWISPFGGRPNWMDSTFFFSSFLIPVYKNFSLETLHILERFFWWAHILGVFFFANYVLYSKHLHIFLAFPNTYFSNLNPKGKIENMDAVTNEVKFALGLAQPDPNNPPAEISRFGAKDVVDLSQKSLLDAYSCTECGRCTSQCPANLTGKALSPRAIMMATRDRVEDLGAYKKTNGADSLDDKTLLGDYITEEEIFACTSCNACTEACPINIDPLSIILELKRYKVMEEAQGPQEWNMMYQNIETSFSPWKFSPNDRGNWTADLNK